MFTKNTNTSWALQHLFCIKVKEVKNTKHKLKSIIGSEVNICIIIIVINVIHEV